jgi:predicted transcriptional regulator
MENTQLTIDEYMAKQPRTRTGDWSTSMDAVASVSLSVSRLLALKTLYGHPGGLTDFELADKTGRQQTSIGKRRGELFAVGLVEVLRDGQGDPVKRPAPSGALALVWVITSAGVDYLRASNNR